MILEPRKKVAIGCNVSRKRTENLLHIARLTKDLQIKDLFDTSYERSAEHVEFSDCLQINKVMNVI